MRDGHPPADLWEVDVRRNIAFQNNQRYLHDRVTEGLGLLYAMHWPFRQFATSRGVRHSPFHDRHVAQNACFGEVAGWERPNWYAPAGEKPEYQYSWFRQNWFDYSAAEHRAIREKVGVLDHAFSLAIGEPLQSPREASELRAVFKSVRDDIVES